MVKDRIQGPAIGLLVTAIVGMAMHVGRLLTLGFGFMLGPWRHLTEGLPHRFFPWPLAGGFAVGFSLLSFVGGAFIVAGSLQMMKQRSYGLAVTAAILAMVPPLSPCCCLGLPIGIWALVVLLNPEVRREFST